MNATQQAIMKDALRLAAPFASRFKTRQGRQELLRKAYEFSARKLAAQLARAHRAPVARPPAKKRPQSTATQNIPSVLVKGLDAIAPIPVGSILKAGADLGDMLVGAPSIEDLLKAGYVFGDAGQSPAEDDHEVVPGQRWKAF